MLNNAVIIAKSGKGALKVHCDLKLLEKRSYGTKIEQKIVQKKEDLHLLKQTV